MKSSRVSYYWNLRLCILNSLSIIICYYEKNLLAFISDIRQLTFFCYKTYNTIYMYTYRIVIKYKKKIKIFIYSFYIWNFFFKKHDDWIWITLNKLFYNDIITNWEEIVRFFISLMMLDMMISRSVVILDNYMVRFFSVDFLGLFYVW